jgi:hypothetical protein
VERDRKRRLPLVQQVQQPASAEADDEQRPHWQWVSFGAAAILVVWLPLAAVVGALAARLTALTDAGRVSPDPVVAAIVSMHALAVGVAALAGGLLVGRWGGGRVGVREAALAGAAASLAAVAGAWVTLGPVPGALAVLAIAVPLAALGGAWGRRGRARGA